MISYFNVDEAEITLMHVVETPWVRLGLDREWFDYPCAGADRTDPEIHLETEMRLEAEEVLEDVHRMLEDTSYSVVTMTLEGNPAMEILGEAESKDHDLIVLGTTGAFGRKASGAWQRLGQSCLECRVFGSFGDACRVSCCCCKPDLSHYARNTTAHAGMFLLETP
jgi:nucleotide-binding universal stress UspA family protein